MQDKPTGADSGPATPSRNDEDIRDQWSLLREVLDVNGSTGSRLLCRLLEDGRELGQPPPTHGNPHLCRSDRNQTRPSGYEPAPGVPLGYVGRGLKRFFRNRDRLRSAGICGACCPICCLSGPGLLRYLDSAKTAGARAER